MIIKIFVYFKHNMYFVKYIYYVYEYIDKYKVRVLINCIEYKYNRSIKFSFLHSSTMF